MKRSPRATARASLVVAALALAAGCSVTNPQTTQTLYTPSDGASTRVGPIEIANIMVVAADEDAPGALVARLVNSTSESLTVGLAAEAPSAVDETFRVAPGSTLAIGPDGDQEVLLDPVGTPPGTMIPMVATLPGGETQEFQVPVLSGVHPELSTLEPSSTATRPSPTPTEPVNEGLPGEDDAEEAGVPGS